MLAWLLLALVSLHPAAAHAEQPHEHGVATLDVALEGRTLTLQFESPLDNLVGFEHAPRNDKERAAIKKMEEKLQAADRLFKPAAAAGCTPRGVKIDHPFRAPAAAGRSPAVKDKAAKTGEEHTEASGSYEMECSKPEALDRLEVLLFNVFPGVKQLKTQAASPRGQRGASLSARARTLTF